MKSTIDKLSEELHIPPEELINRGVLAYLERELRLAESDIADLREKDLVTDRSDVERKITNKEIPSHPAWEDLIVWENAEDYIKKLKRAIQHLSESGALPVR